MARLWIPGLPSLTLQPHIPHQLAEVGEIALVVQPIESGSGRVKVGDSEWIARGPDTAVGQRVRISGNDGAILLVEPIALIAEARTPETDETPAEG